nr:hypothetical protein [Tanacetum cinerariifolium]
MFFANVKAKRKKCGIERNYVLRSIKEQKKSVAMSLDSLFGQQATITPAPPKIISKSVNGDFIAPPVFLEDVSGEPKLRLINELMTLEVFVESKGIAVETYEIKYMFPKVVSKADDYGDCGVWVLYLFIQIEP